MEIEKKTKNTKKKTKKFSNKLCKKINKVYKKLIKFNKVFKLTKFLFRRNQARVHIRRSNQNFYFSNHENKINKAKPLPSRISFNISSFKERLL